jgi:hypothetical protein
MFVAFAASAVRMIILHTSKHYKKKYYTTIYCLPTMTHTLDTSYIGQFVLCVTLSPFVPGRG